MIDRPPPTLRSALLRAVRERCPQCGEGRVFRSHPFQNEDACDACDWRFERGPGHWLGGTEVNMLVTFPAGLLVGMPLVLLTDGSAWSLALGCAATVAISLLSYRRCRCLFFAIDHLLDPVADPSAGGAPPDRDDDAPRDGGPAPRGDGGSIEPGTPSLELTAVAEPTGRGGPPTRPPKREPAPLG